MNELGFDCVPKDDPNFENQMAIARSDMGDLEKAEKLGVTRFLGEPGLTYFDTVFADHCIDIRTGELFGRYFAEEQDTIRLLTGCYDELQCQAEAGAPARGRPGRPERPRAEGRRPVPHRRRAAPDRLRPGHAGQRAG